MTISKDERKARALYRFGKKLLAANRPRKAITLFEQAIMESTRGPYPLGGLEYERYAQAIAQKKSFMLFSAEKSRKYTGSKQLVEMGILKPEPGDYC